MNKEEIEKAKEDLSFMNEGDYITREMSNSKDILIKYIESLELINETWQFRERTKELEQKESVLDKVIDIVKIIIKRTEKECMYGTTDMLEDLQKILKIIEGEKK